MNIDYTTIVELFTNPASDPALLGSLATIASAVLILLFLAFRMKRLANRPSADNEKLLLDNDSLAMSGTPYFRGGIIILIITFGVFGGWAFYAPLDTAVVTSGRITVETSRKTVQHLEGGIVSEILVKDGDQVVKGQPLIRMSETQPKAQLEVVELQYMDALILQDRLHAELEGDKLLIYSEEINHLAAEDKTVSGMAKVQRQIFESRRESIDGETAILKNRIGQLKAQIDGFRQLGNSNQERIDSYQEEISEWEILYKEQLADKQHLRQIRHQKSQLEGELAKNIAQIAQLNIRIGETEEQILLQKKTFQTEVVEELRKTQSSIADFKARMTALSDTLSRTIVRSPDDGTIVGLELHTEGAVIGAGKPIMYVVPGSSNFVIETQISSLDIDKVTVGLESDIRFPAFKSFRGVIPGTVIEVSADSFLDERTGASYYDATVKIAKGGYNTMVDEGIDLISGMPAEVIIKTGQRTLLDYIVKPFSDMFVRSLREE